jgi:hypothetical protein
VVGGSAVLTGSNPRTGPGLPVAGMRTPNCTMVIPNNTQAAPPAAAVAGDQALDLTQAEDRAFLTWNHRGPCSGMRACKALA